MRSTLNRFQILVRAGAALVVLVSGGRGSELELAAMTLFVQGNQNDFVSIEREAKETAQSIEASRDIAISVARDDSIEGFKLRLRSETARKETMESVAKQLTTYLNLRVEGHSMGYAAWVAFSGLNKPPEELLRRHPSLKTKSHSIAFPWIREDIDYIAAFAGRMPKLSSGFVVVDGDLAWVYSSSAQFSECIDAIEFSPAVREIFVRVASDLEKQRIERPPATTSVSWGYEYIERVLRDNHGINWRSPSKLNPGVLAE